MNQPTPFDLIQNKLYTTSFVNGLDQILGKAKGKPYVVSVLSFIKNSALSGDPRKDLTRCDPASIMGAVRDAAKLRLEIDGRGHAHLVKYGNNVNLQIGYRGYLARLQSSLNGFTAYVDVVYKGDQIEVVQDGLNGHIKHVKADPFANRPDTDIIGVYAQISYLLDDQRVTYVTTMSRAEIDKVAKSAKTRDIWNAWFSEKAKVAVIRRACKMHFSAVTHDLDAADDTGYDLERANRAETVKTATSDLIGAVQGAEMKDVTPEVQEVQHA